MVSVPCYDIGYPSVVVRRLAGDFVVRELSVSRVVCRFGERVGCEVGFSGLLVDHILCDKLSLVVFESGDVVVRLSECN